jgi:hypothetical protein
VSKVLKIAVFIVLDLILFVVVASAQTSVSPLIVEGKGPRVKGEFSITNQGLLPAVVTLSPVGFMVSPQDETTFHELEPTTHITLSESSAKIGPRQSRVFAYDITCDKLPCWLTVYTSAVIGKTPSGVQVKTWIPHTVYICDKKEKHCRASVRRNVFGLQ